MKFYFGSGPFSGDMSLLFGDVCPKKKHFKDNSRKKLEFQSRMRRGPPRVASPQGIEL